MNNKSMHVRMRSYLVLHVVRAFGYCFMVYAETGLAVDIWTPPSETVTPANELLASVSPAMA